MKYHPKRNKLVGNLKLHMIVFFLPIALKRMNAKTISIDGSKSPHETLQAALRLLRRERIISEDQTSDLPIRGPTIQTLYKPCNPCTEKYEISRLLNGREVTIAVVGSHTSGVE